MIQPRALEETGQGTPVGIILEKPSGGFGIVASIFFPSK